MLRVMFLTPDFPPAKGGIQTLMFRLAQDAERLTVRVVTRDHPDALAFDAATGLDVRRSGSIRAPRRANTILNARSIWEAAAFRPEAVVSGHIVASPAATVIARAAGAPAVQYLHADEVRGRPRLAEFALRHASATVAVSSYSAGIARQLGADPSRVHCIPNGVDIPAKSRVRRADVPTLVTVARLEQRYKGHDVVMRALPLVRARVPGVRWLIVGDGSLRGALEELATTCGVKDDVRFLGRVSDDERDALLDQSHVFVMPSRLPPERTGGEGFGIAYLEAAARGLAVVAGRAGGAEDAVVHGETGLLVEPEDHVAVADALVELLLNHELAERMGRAAASRARDFTWPIIARRLEDLLFDLVGPR